MDGTVRKHIVISAVNIRKGGTLTVLRDCLAYLSGKKDWQVTALVHDRKLCDFPGISYIEIPWSSKSWLRRLWCEYVSMGRISRKLPEVDLWFSLHDTTPRVRARRQAVYCHTSFPFLKTRRQDWKMDYKIPAFARFTRYAYRMNVRRNSYLVVQQDWMRKGLSGLTGFPEQRIIVAPPAFSLPEISGSATDELIFLYPSTPDCHKNFEVFCEASRMLEERVGRGRFRSVITLDGSENRYSRWLKARFGGVSSVDFRGYLSKEELRNYYGLAGCLVFPSRIETWGLPISEFLPSGKPMILSDLPYAHETAAGAKQVAFFPCDDPAALSERMQELLEGRMGAFREVERKNTAEPRANGWEELFGILTEE
ncbi:MAG: glycosyltransferase family 4 protein [Bacteroidales bacterium]|nr:glycosyltransferase family 4 protein [Bacteroidales bacterium]